MRADAVRNRERVVAAAIEVFAERGLDADVAEIAARACVGKGTVYRSFPTKEHLVAAIVVERLRWMEDLANEALTEDDAWEAFSRVLLASAERQARDRSLGGSIGATSELPDVAEARAAMIAATDKLMRRAQRQGRMRPGVDTADVRVLFTGVGHVLSEAGVRDPAVWRRYATLVLDALRADGAQRLSGRRF
jgi:AcrR family transcriptional regulator